MKLKVGDKVVVIAGSSKGKEGKITKTFKDENKVIVEGVNIVKKHLKPSQANPDGGIVEHEAPIHVSNVALYDSKTKKTVKVGYKVEDGEKVRVNKKTGKEIKGGKK